LCQELQEYRRAGRVLSCRQSNFQQAKADHDFKEQELELKTNTRLTREIRTLTTELHDRLLNSAR
jgi:hypothetical protein